METRTRTASLPATEGTNINSGDNRDPHTNTLPSSTVNGGAGGDEIHGGDGADDMYGGTGSDAQFGDNDPDVINGGSGTADFIDGGPEKASATTLTTT